MTYSLLAGMSGVGVYGYRRTMKYVEAKDRGSWVEFRVTFPSGRVVKY